MKRFVLLLLLFKFKFVYAVDCVTDKECNYKGTCENNICICDDRWVTINDNNMCNYLQKDKFTALMLSIFVGYFGVDQWYIQNYELAGPKMGISILLIIYSIVAYIKKLYYPVFVIPFLLLLSISFSWWLGDIIKISTKELSDGKNVNLY
jgi:hypothetical protein